MRLSHFRPCLGSLTDKGAAAYADSGGVGRMTLKEWEGWLWRTGKDDPRGVGRMTLEQRGGWLQRRGEDDPRGMGRMTPEEWEGWLWSRGEDDSGGVGRMTPEEWGGWLRSRGEDHSGAEGRMTLEERGGWLWRRGEDDSGGEGRMTWRNGKDDLEEREGWLGGVGKGGEGLDQPTDHAMSVPSSEPGLLRELWGQASLEQMIIFNITKAWYDVVKKNFFLSSQQQKYPFGVNLKAHSHSVMSSPCVTHAFYRLFLDFLEKRISQKLRSS